MYGRPILHRRWRWLLVCFLEPEVNNHAAVLQAAHLMEDYGTEHVGGIKNAIRDVVFRSLIWSRKHSGFGA